MAKSLNPNAAENRDSDSTPQSAPPISASQSGSNHERRNFLTKVAAGAIGVVLGLFPIAVGALTILDPLVGKKKKKGQLIRVASVSQLPDDGTPIRVPIVSDLVDAWNRETNQPIGAVYLRKDKDKVVAFNAICPHAGCFIGYSSQRAVFQCPCHTSAFELDGDRIEPSPSPRDLDPLSIDEKRLSEGEIWIDFVNYYPGKATRIAKA